MMWATRCIVDPRGARISPYIARNQTKLIRRVATGATTDQSDNHQDTEVKVFFPAEKKEMDAYPGASLAIVAQKCGVDIQYGCHTGACGVCEVELRQYEPTDGGPGEGGDAVVVRACVAVVPRGWKRVEIDTMVDSAWAMDGWDT